MATFCRLEQVKDGVIRGVKKWSKQSIQDKAVPRNIAMYNITAEHWKHHYQYIIYMDKYWYSL